VLKNTVTTMKLLSHQPDDHIHTDWTTNWRSIIWHLARNQDKGPGPLCEFFLQAHHLDRCKRTYAIYRTQHWNSSTCTRSCSQPLGLHRSNLTAPLAQHWQKWHFWASACLKLHACEFLVDCSEKSLYPHVEPRHLRGGLISQHWLGQLGAENLLCLQGDAPTIDTRL
jgi:hypothetical protein